jgi:hypothetical protein
MAPRASSRRRHVTTRIAHRRRQNRPSFQVSYQERSTMSDPSPVKPTISIDPIETPASAPLDPVIAPRPTEPPRRPEPPTTIVDKAIETSKAYAQYVWADVLVLFAEIKPGFVKFAIKQKNFLIGLVIVILLLLWLF